MSGEWLFSYFRKALPCAIFLIALVCLVELAFRCYLFGLAGLNPVSMNSFTQLHTSGLVQRASIPAVYYELKPNYAGIYKGTIFRTNSFGLRDQEYALEKPANVFRVAVLGSSWTMGSGVDQEHIWHSLLEEQLNSASPGQRQYEFINFGVDQYGMGELIATLEHKVRRYAPDLVILCLTHYTPTVLWPEPTEQYQRLEKHQAFFDWWSLRVIAATMGLRVFADNSSRPSIDDPTVAQQQLERAITSIKAFRAETGVPVVIAKLAYGRRWMKDPTDAAWLLAEQNNLTYFDIADNIRADQYRPNQLRVSNWDNHPNALAHQLIADAILENLQNRNFLPPTYQSASDAQLPSSAVDYAN